MQNKYLYFLTVAEELNISRAAKKLFVSQQCLSAHIKKLESEYDTLLLNRKPKLSLTVAGELMVRTLKQMQLLESNIKSELAISGAMEKGYLKIGIHSSRSEQFGTLVSSSFWEKFPNVTLSITDGSTSTFEYMLENGQMDMYIGVNPIMNAKREKILLFSEKIFIAMTDNMLRQYFPDQYPECLEWQSEGVDLHKFEHVPFLMSHDSQSTLTSAMTAYLEENNVNLNIRLYSNNGLTRNSLASMDYGAALCVELRKNSIENLASTHVPPSSHLYFFPIKGFQFHNNTLNEQI